MNLLYTNRDAVPGDVVQVPRHGRGIVFEAIPYNSPGFPMGQVKVRFADGHTLQTCNHPDYARVIPDTLENRFAAALEFVRRLECLLRWQEFFDVDGQRLASPIEVVNAILAGQLDPFAQIPEPGTITPVVEGQPAQ